MNSAEIKRMAYALGADLCGIAPIERFTDAPEGYHPRDVLADCQSVISLGVRSPVLALKSTSHVPYTRIRNSITPKMDAIALDLCIELEKHGVAALPIPTNESQWDKKNAALALHHFAETCSPSSRSGHHRQAFVADYAPLRQHGLAWCSADQHSAGRRHAVGYPLQRLQPVC